MGRVKTWYGDKITGSIPEGCELCAKGAKLVLFVSGTCPYNCFYCPLSKDRKSDSIFANEQHITSIDEAIAEAQAIDALGAGITGGEPTLRLNRTVAYIEGLKSAFGEEFHIHLYTARAVPKEELRKLHAAGLDEIRFHFPQLQLNEHIKNSIVHALDFDWSVGIEVPALPDKYDELRNIVRFAVNTNLGFVNLNELEFTETNQKNLTERGFTSLSSSNPGVEGSEELALRILKEFRKTKLALHYCSSSYKDRVQLKNRFLRRAENYKHKFDVITDEGLVVRGRILTKSKKVTENILDFIVKTTEISSNDYFVSAEHTIFLNYNLLTKLAYYLVKEFPDQIMQIAIIHQYPMDNGFIAYLDPLFEASSYTSEIG